MSQVISLTGIRDIEFDPERGSYYFSTAFGAFVTWDTATRSVTSEKMLGGELTGMDLSADGSFAYVGQLDVETISLEDQTYRIFIEKVDLDTGVHTRIEHTVERQERGVTDVAISSAGIGLFTTSSAGFGSPTDVRQFDTNDGDAITPRNDDGLVFGLWGGSFLTGSANGDHVLILERGVSSAPMYVYDASTDEIISSVTGFTLGGSGINRQPGDISSQTGALVNLAYGFRVFDLTFTELADLRSFDVDDAQFSADGSLLFGLNADNAELYVFATADWSQTATYDLLDVLGDAGMSLTGIGTAHNPEEIVFLNESSPSPGFSLLNFNLQGTTDADDLTGTGGDDWMSGSDGRDRLSAGNGDDTLLGGEGDDSLRGDAGDDVMRGDEGKDFLNGGAGRDTADYSDENGRLGIVANLGTGEIFDTFGTRDRVVSVERVVGTSRADAFIGSDGADVFVGAYGVDTYDGGDGLDMVSFLGVGVAVNAYLAFDVARMVTGNEVLTSIESLEGSDFNDRLVGDTGQNTLLGAAGDDILRGRGGDDRLDGGDGDDLLVSDDGTDTLLGGDGSDVLLALGGDDLLEGGASFDFLYGGRGNDMMHGGDGNDRMRGNRDHDTMQGGSGNDHMFGGGGDDTLNGDADADDLFGGSGRDTLAGGAGNDVMSGGVGGGTGDGVRDVFVMNSTAAGGGGFDRIRDFEDGLDQINLGGFGFSDFESDLRPLAVDRASGMRLDFGGGDVLFVDGFTTALFDSSDVIL